MAMLSSQSSSSSTAELESSQPFSSQSEQSQQSQDSAPQFDYVSTKKRRGREEKRPSQWVCLVPGMSLSRDYTLLCCSLSTHPFSLIKKECSMVSAQS